MTDQTSPPERPPCPAFQCLRADGICCPDDACDAEGGIYVGETLTPWWRRDEEGDAA